MFSKTRVKIMQTDYMTFGISPQYHIITANTTNINIKYYSINIQTFMCTERIH